MPSKMSRGDILDNYVREVGTLRRLGLEWNLKNNEIDKIIQDSFDHLAKLPQYKNTQSETNCRSKLVRSLWLRIIKIICLMLFVIVCVYLLLFFHKPSYNFVVRNIQELIYPSMKLLRWMALPIVRRFPSITVWYDELCLVENPYFRAVDINCWPCEEVRSILDLSETDNPRHYQPHSAFPYIVKGCVPEVTFSQIQDMYLTHQSMLDRDASRISSSVPGWKTVADLMNHQLEQNPTPDKDAHVMWRLNRMEPARVVRKLFPRPPFLPNSINVERFILIDEPNAPPYTLPFPEGYKVFVMQGSGERLVVLEPVPDCAVNCSRVSVLLKPNYFLYYNSWFYRPKSNPIANSSSIAVTYIGSY
ncbi:uncharacterized protein [Anabrus simplex]|uniref:uncharacterized protein n=1 Tax=Anabrus simplex TaxID=316456 RepID=UPI0035A3C8D0